MINRHFLSLPSAVPSRGLQRQKFSEIKRGLFGKCQANDLLHCVAATGPPPINISMRSTSS
jgi:hypothetical protein